MYIKINNNKWCTKIFWTIKYSRCLTRQFNSKFIKLYTNQLLKILLFKTKKNSSNNKSQSILRKRPPRAFLSKIFQVWWTLPKVKLTSLLFKLKKWMKIPILILTQNKSIKKKKMTKKQTKVGSKVAIVKWIWEKSTRRRAQSIRIKAVGTSSEDERLLCWRILKDSRMRRLQSWNDWLESQLLARYRDVCTETRQVPNRVVWTRSSLTIAWSSSSNQFAWI